MNAVLKIDENQPPGRGASLTPRQRRALVALLEQPTLERAARAARVAPSTLRAWRRGHPAFRAELRLLEDELFRESLSRLQRGVSRAVECLERLTGRHAPPAVQVAAAARILEHALRSRDLVTFEERLAAIEAKLAERPGDTS